MVSHEIPLLGLERWSPPLKGGGMERKREGVGIPVCALGRKAGLRTDEHGEKGGNFRHRKIFIINVIRRKHSKVS